MKLETQEYRPKIDELNYFKHLKEIDQKIGYIKEEYQNKYIEDLKKKLDGLKNKIPNKDELLLLKWKVILMELKKYENTNLPINLHICMRYLMIHLLTLEECKKIKTTELFQVSKNNDWCFVNIYTLFLEDKALYYIHPRHQNDFSLYEIQKDQVEYYERCMKLVK